MTTCTTPTNEYEALRSKINEMFPERLKLELGCEVVLHNEARPLPTAIVAWQLQDRKCHYEGLRDNGIIATFCLDEIKEILGTPLTIADVLRALGSEYLIDGSGDLQKYDLLDGRKTLATFTLSLHLSAPDNASACAAVLRLLENK